jgi:serine phosphatase RsbU (regulator of sigma subunit)
VADHPPVVVVGAVRPCKGETVSGDAWHVDHHGSRWRVALVDGLGHGPDAAAAASAAVAYLSAHPDLDAGDALRGCHAAPRGTRGAAIAVAEIDPDAGRLTYAGVGNVEARLWSDGQGRRPVSFRGIVGVTMPSVRVFELALGQDWLLLMHTDGVSTRADVESLPELARRDASRLAAEVLERWGRERDDATVVVACPPRKTDHPDAPLVGVLAGS